MAKENVLKFMEKLAADEGLQEQLRGKKADEVVARAAEMGFSFSKEDLKDFAKGCQELTPGQLEQAAGGSAADFERLIDDTKGGIGSLAKDTKITVRVATNYIEGGASSFTDDVKATFRVVAGFVGSWFD